MGLDAGISWDLGIDGHAEVTEVIDVIADVRDSRSLPHVLRLPDTQLMIAERERKTDTATAPPTDAIPPTDTPPTDIPATAGETIERTFKFWIAQHGTIDPQLTKWARSNYKDELNALAGQIDLAPPPPTATTSRSRPARTGGTSTNPTPPRSATS